MTEFPTQGADRRNPFARAMALSRCIEPVETAALKKGQCAQGVPARSGLGAWSTSLALTSRCDLTGGRGHGFVLQWGAEWSTLQAMNGGAALCS